MPEKVLISTTYDVLSQEIKPLWEMDNLADTKIVTIVAMLAKANGNILSLYKFIAGNLDDGPEVLKTNSMITTVRIMNDELHDSIHKLWADKFLSKIKDEQLRLKMEEENLPFIVISHIPGCPAEENDAVMPVTENGADYTYRHPNKPGMRFVVHAN